VNHARSSTAIATYKAEPYVVAADVYALSPHIGRGGWTWYTGSASWSYRVSLEGVLGFEKRGQRLRIDPCIPTHWPSVAIEYRFGTSTYSIDVRNPHGVSRGVLLVTVDDLLAKDGVIDLVDDGRRHVIVVELGLGRQDTRHF